MRKLIALCTFILLYTTQTTPIYDTSGYNKTHVTQYITQPLIQTDKDNPLPVTITLNSEQTEDMMSHFNEILAESIAPQLKETWQITIGSLLNSENAIRFGWPIALFAIVGISGLYGARVAWKLIEKKILHPRPTILQPGSKYGWIDRWKRSRLNYITPAMIFDALVKERLEEIQEKTKNIRERIRQGKKVTYDNLLLYGKPGTGKTLFAQILADNTDMDFLCATAASLLQSGIEGIKYFDEIMEMAAKSKYGLILFIDEADALFINRNLLNPESDHYKLLNHILSATGNGSSKIMIIAATNHAHIMDPAMGRRFQDRIKMPLPNEQTRNDLLNLYINQYLLDGTNADFDNLTISKIFTQKRINIIAQQTAGLSHAEIKDMVFIISKKANASKEGTVTEKHVQSSIDEAIEKKEALKKDKVKMKKKKEIPNEAPGS